MEKKCTIDWCKRNAAPHGKYCSAHYAERGKYGHFLTLEERAENRKKKAEQQAKISQRMWDDPEFAAKRREDIKAAGLLKRTTCSVPGCGKRATWHKLCPTHHWHKKKYGDPLAGPIRPNRGKGIQYSQLGYLMRYVPEHPNSDIHGYVMAHRLLMEKKLGRFLKKSEVVHHRDGNKINNDIENLELFKSNSAHISSHMKERFGK